MLKYYILSLLAGVSNKIYDDSLFGVENKLEQEIRPKRNPSQAHDLQK